MDCVVINVPSSFNKGFRKRWVGMDCMIHIFNFQFQSDSKSCFGYHFSGMRRNYQYSNNYSSFIKYLNKTTRVSQTTGLCTRRKRKGSSPSTAQLTNES